MQSQSGVASIDKECLIGLRVLKLGYSTAGNEVYCSRLRRKIMSRSRRGGDDDDGVGRRIGQPPKPGVALSLSVLLLGLGMTGMGSYLYVGESAALENTAEVTAEITDTSVEQVPGSRGREAYVPVVTFRYQYRGTDYTSDRIFPRSSQPSYNERSTAEERLAPYPVGESVTAYVDPDAPGAAFLENSRSGKPAGAIVFGAAISLFSGGRLLQVMRRSRDIEEMS